MATDSTDYDHLGETWVSPSGLDNTGKRLNDLAQSVADSINNIDNTLQSLVLNNWQGATKQEADDFNIRWVEVMGQMFGGKYWPNGGVLNAITGGIITAVNNFNKAETGLVNVWSQFAGKLPSANQPSSPPSHDTPPNDMDPNQTAITANYGH
ncbi:MAG TPA: WXG100 family type VII secretion target [Streptosporangiaceae bacterium]|jgi:hypothetical protein|nr:WXG100 family type VII secretion target [Streptosporangiaceae bacterium]